eukprot:gnl/Dysnectes_brevis/1426_a1615_950.p1 GENE.gnl/Dysnectes_brevis/1426_a1615_950~~gnl/Dysnectes_brevis/1426_a1615_950.p1  ORF type:complete len:734 (-),score=278.80 gnl/Dysnectes_brevis/1426_a1615_950:38-2197(-)
MKPLQTYRCPTGPIDRDECIYCFADKWNPQGLYLCLSCDTALCRSHIVHHNSKHGHTDYLHVRYVEKTDVPKLEDLNPLQKAIALSNKEDRMDILSSIVRMPLLEPIQGELDEIIEESAACVLAAGSQHFAIIQESFDSRKADCIHLTHLFGSSVPPGLRPIDLKAATCDHPECGSTCNLWLCLGCGHVGCGRTHYDGTGGKGHAKLHASGCCPVVLKLGSLCASGDPELFCYSCDDMLKTEKTLLALFLRRFGEDLPAQLTSGVASEKSLAEQEIAASMDLSLTSCLEGGVKLSSVKGPHCKGLRNVGNTCYAASVIQALIACQAVPREMGDPEAVTAHHSTCPSDPGSCLECQQGRLFRNLFAASQTLQHLRPHPGGLIQPAAPALAVPGKRGKQQDGLEFLQLWSQRAPWLHERLAFRMRRETICMSCGVIRTSAPETQTTLPFSLGLFEGHPSPLDLGRALQEDLSGVSDIVQGQRCPFCGAANTREHTAVIRRRTFVSTPKLLVVVAMRQSFDMATGQPRKIMKPVNAPNVLSVANSIAQPITETPEQTQLWDRYVAAHAVPTESFDITPLLEMQLSTPEACQAAMVATNGNIDAAVNLLLTGVPLDAAVNPAEAERAEHLASCGPSSVDQYGVTYRLIAAVTHQGSSVHTGHYVAHTRVNGRLTGGTVIDGPDLDLKSVPPGNWLLFNDEKAAVAPLPPLPLAYMYFYVKEEL